MRICILIPSHERYRPIAEFTAAKLGERWLQHPPLFFCGLPAASSPNVLPFSCGSQDWFNIVLEAVNALLERGYEGCYLILDDHPPFGRCHRQHLNESLPALMRKHDAVHISLWGWGQGSGKRGRIMGKEDWFLEHCDESYHWKFELHPGLWDLRRLRELLALLVRHTEAHERTAWNFEVFLGAANSRIPVPESERRACYRVCGLAMSAQRARALTYPWFMLERAAGDFVRWTIGHVQDPAAKDRFLKKMVGLYHRYDGPYPMFRNGLMNLGKLNPHLIFFLTLNLRWKLLAELRRAVALADDSELPKV